VRRGILPFMRVTRLACVLAALLALAGGAAGPTRPVESTRFVVSCSWPGDPSAETRQATQRRARAPFQILRTAALTFGRVQHSPVRTRRIDHSLFQRPPPDTDLS
jgi:hypothetical protein